MENIFEFPPNFPQYQSDKLSTYQENQVEIQATKHTVWIDELFRHLAKQSQRRAE